MLQAPVIASVAGRLGPWLGRAATTNKAIVPSIVARLRTAGVVVGEKIDDIVSVFKTSPTSAMTVLGVMASLGFSVSELFSGDDSVKAVKSKLDDISNGRSPLERARAFERLFEISETSVDKSLSITDEDANRHEALRQVLAWAEGFFGSQSAALQAHVMMQAFVELDYQTVVRGYSQLKLRP